MSPYSTGFVTDAKVSRIGKFRLSSRWFTGASSSLYSNVAFLQRFFSLRRITWSEISASHLELAVIELADSLGKLDVQNAPFCPGLHAAWARYARARITWDPFDLQTTVEEQSSEEQLYHLDIERVRLVNSRRVRTFFVANQQGVFQVPSSVPWAYFDLATAWKFAL